VIDVFILHLNLIQHWPARFAEIAKGNARVATAGWPSLGFQRQKTAVLRQKEASNARGFGRAFSPNVRKLDTKPDQVDEEKDFITSYMALTGASESTARSVYMFREVVDARQDTGNGTAGGAALPGGLPAASDPGLDSQMSSPSTNIRPDVSDSTKPPVGGAA
jgi:hypothetical protein